MKNKIKLLVLVFCLVLTGGQFGCSHFRAVSPQGFAVYPQKKSFKAINPSQVLYKVSTRPNKEKANLEFWSRVLQNRFEGVGYQLLDTLNFQIKSGEQGKLSKWILSHGQNERAYLVGVVVSNKKVLVIESEGEYIDFKAEFPNILEAIKGIQLK